MKGENRIIYKNYVFTYLSGVGYSSKYLFDVLVFEIN